MGDYEVGPETRLSVKRRNKAIKTKDSREGTQLQRGTSEYKGENRNSLEAISAQLKGLESSAGVVGEE